MRPIDLRMAPPLTITRSVIGSFGTGLAQRSIDVHRRLEVENPAVQNEVFGAHIRCWGLTLRAELQSGSL
jgi:hypothetical protein